MSGSRRPKNAMLHGLYSDDVVLPWESEQEFKDLLKGFRDEFFPVGAAEEAAVCDLASLHWKKRRLIIGSQLAYQRHPDAGALADAGSEGWRGVADYVRRTSGDGDRVHDAMRAMAKSHAVAVGKVYALIGELTEQMSSRDAADHEGKQTVSTELQNLLALAKELNVVNNELIVPTLKLVENNDLDQKVCERAYRPEILERELKIHAEIDKRIEKALARLVAIKEFKKYYGPKDVKASTDEKIGVLARGPRQPGED
jgi:Asp-tRNA(Asn)/Glu-tRNA(Gln) amidotransferase C subunit